MANRFSLEAIFRAKDQLTAVFARLEGRVARFGRSAARTFRDLDRANTAMLAGFARGTAMVGAAGVAAGLAIGHVGKAGADFEEAITAVGAVSLMTRDEIADLEKKALELGATTKFTATQAANGMELMAKAGFTNAEIVQGIGGVLNAAAAEGAELAETANHVSNVLKGMGLASSEAGRVADVLTLASSRTNSSISSLGESMANVSSTARQFNIPLEQAVASVAMLQDVGLDASVAGSAVNTMLTQLAAPTDALKAKMKKMGVTFQDSAGNMLPFQDVLANLAKGAEKSGGNMDQVAFFAELVGLRGQKAAANLKDLFASGKFQGLAKELQGAAGSAEKMATLRMQNVKGDLLLLESAVDGVKVALFNTESGPLRGVIQGMTAWITKNQEFIKLGFVEAMDRARFAIDAFSSGVRDGLRSVKDGVETVLGPLGDFDDIFEGGSTWPENVKLLGQAVGVAGPLFIAYTVTVKATTLAIGSFELASKAASIATGLVGGAARATAAATTALSVATTGSTVAANASTAAERLRAAALAFGRIATTRYTFATLASGAATRASALASKLWTAAVTLYTIATNRSTAATVAGTIATRAGQIAQVVSNATRALGTAALNVYAIARGRATVAETAGAASAAAANLALAPLLVTLGAVTAAVGSLILAWQQWEGLKKAAGGAEGLAAGWESFKKGEGFFKGVDENFNKRAREEFAREQAAKASAAPMVTPQERTAKSVSETSTNTTDSAELTVKAEPGTKAKVTKQPKRTPIKLTPSGAF